MAEREGDSPVGAGILPQRNWETEAVQLLRGTILSVRIRAIYAESLGDPEEATAMRMYAAKCNAWLLEYENRPQGHWQKEVPKVEGSYWAASRDGAICGPFYVRSEDGDAAHLDGDWNGWWWSLSNLLRDLRPGERHVEA